MPDPNKKPKLPETGEPPKFPETDKADIEGGPEATPSGPEPISTKGLTPETSDEEAKLREQIDSSAEVVLNPLAKGTASASNSLNKNNEPFGKFKGTADVDSGRLLEEEIAELLGPK